MLPADVNRVGRHVELVVPAERQAARHEAVEPAVACLGAERHVSSRVPVARHEKIDVVVDDEVVAETGHVALVVARRAHQVVQAEAGDEDAAASPRADVLKDEGEPHDRNVPYVEHRGPTHHHALAQPLHLMRAEVVVGHGVVVGCDLAAGTVQACGARVHGEVAADVPRRVARQGLAHRTAPDAGVVAHHLADEHRALVEQVRPAGGVEPAARLLIADRIRFELRAIAIDERLAPQ